MTTQDIKSQYSLKQSKSAVAGAAVERASDLAGSVISSGLPDPKGGQPSISPPAKVKTPSPLASGIDTLYLAIDLEWRRPEYLAALGVLKAEAVAKTDPRPGMMADWPFLLQPFGRRGYEWLLDGREFSLRIGDWLKPQSRPSVIAEIRSETLWHMGAERAVDRILTLLRHESGHQLDHPTIKAVKVSRVDFCLDLLLPAGFWSLALLDNLVCRAKDVRPYLKSGTLTGIGIGSGPLSARLYDKPLEIRTKSKKDWMFDIWKLPEVPEGFQVIRVEFEIHREVIKQLGIEGPEELFLLQRNAWSYCTQSWLKFQDRPGTHHTQRETLPWWETVQNGYQGAQAAHPLVRGKAMRSNRTQLIRQAYGLLSSLTALDLEDQGEDMAVAGDMHTCLSAVFESVGLLGEYNDFAEKVLNKRARYHRTRQKEEELLLLRRELGFINQTKEGQKPKGGNNGSD